MLLYDRNTCVFNILLLLIIIISVQAAQYNRSRLRRGKSNARMYCSLSAIAFTAYK